MSVRGAFSRSLIGEGGAENNRFASKAPNALTFFLSDGFIEKVRHLVRPPIKSTVAPHSRSAPGSAMRFTRIASSEAGVRPRESGDPASCVDSRFRGNERRLCLPHILRMDAALGQRDR